MKDFNLYSYNDFNESNDVLVSKIDIEGSFYGGLCTYNKDSNTTFYLKNAALTYVNKGMKYMIVNKQEFILEEGDLLYIPKNSVVFTDIRTVINEFQSFNILFPIESSETNLSFGEYNLSDLNSLPFAIYQNPNVAAHFDSVLHNDNLENKNYEYLLEYIFKSFQDLLFNSHNKSNILSNEIIVISRMIIDTIYENISLPEMAEACNMSLATFKRKFTNAYGISPKTWIRNVRLQAAYFHLKTNSMNVSEVATLTNFDNLAHFSYTFKKYFNITPSSTYIK